MEGGLDLVMQSGNKPSQSHKKDASGPTPQRGNPLFKIGIPITALLLLTLMGAGMMPGALVTGLIVVLCGLFFNNPAVTTPVKSLYWIGIATLVFVLITLAPIPVSNLGAKRAELFTNAQTQLAKLPAVYPADEIEALDLSPPDQDDAKLMGRLSLNYSGTVRFGLLACGAFAMFWLSTALSARQRAIFLQVVTVGAATVAVIGIIGRFFIPMGRELWWFIPVDAKVGGGPFINRNHFASFCAMLTPAAFSLTLSPSLGHRRHSHPKHPAQKTDRHANKSANSPAKERTRDVSSENKSRSRTIWRTVFVICLILLVTGTIQSYSRGGMLSMLIGIGIAACFWVRSRPMIGVSSTALALAVIVSFLFWPSQKVQQRIQTLSDLKKAAPARAYMRNEAIRQWQAFPITGGGAEAYRTVGGLFRSHPWNKSPLYVENEYVQLLADGGWVGLGLAASLVVAFILAVYSSYHRLHSRHHSIRAVTRALAERGQGFHHPHDMPPRAPPKPILAAAAGTCAVLLLHFACDFPCRIPLNAFVAAALLGMAMPLPIRSKPTRAASWRLQFPALLILAAIFLLLGRNGRLHLDNPKRLRHADAPTLVQAIRAAPSYWVPWSQLAGYTAQVAYKASGADPASADASPAVEVVEGTDAWGVYKFSVQAQETAAKLNPQDYRLWLNLAETQMDLPNVEVDDIRASFKKAVAAAPNRRQIWHKWLQFELHEGGFDAIWNVLEHAATKAPTRIAVRLWREQLKKQRKSGNHRNAYLCASRITELQPRTALHWRTRANLADKLELYEEAIESLNKAVEIQPDHWQSWMKLGKLELKRKHDRRANQAFTQAIHIRPSLREKVDELWARIKLDD